MRSPNDNVPLDSPGRHSLHFVRGTLLLLLLASCMNAQSTERGPASEDLKQTIAALDQALFETYNTCQTDRFDTFLADDIEFYHDQGGVTLGRAAVTESVKKNICGINRRVRRELVEGSLEVDQIKNYGAVEVGEHRFYQTEPGQKEKLTGTAKFVMLWQKKGGEWKLSRVISYVHRAVG